MRTVLLTGASGFTGRYLHKALEGRNYRVIPLEFGGPNPCDLTDSVATQAAVRKACPDAVIHLAAVSFVGHDNPEEFYRVNVFGTLNLLEAVANLEHAPRVLIASSGNVYGTPDIEVLDESVCPAPVNHYANSKLAMEHMVKANWFSRLPVVITRPFNYTGPGQEKHFLIPKIVQHFRDRARFIELGNLNVSRDFSDVDDVVAAYIALLESEAHSEVVNICSGQATALLDVIRVMNQLAGYEIEVRVNPEFVRQNEVSRLVGSATKLRSLVSLPPMRPLAETLRRMFEA
jgi:nucleoside-diphosphate-sugar epimerase